MKHYLIPVSLIFVAILCAVLMPGQNPAPSGGYPVQSPLHIVANNPTGTDGTPNEQIFVENPTTTGGSAQAMLGFGVWNGSSVVKCGWVGVTSYSFSFAPEPLNTYIENNCAGGLKLLSDDPTYGKIEMFTGGYTSDAYKRVLITPVGQVVIEETNGSTQGLAIQQTSDNGSAALSYSNINFYDSTTLNSQITGTGANYYNSGINTAPSSLNLQNYATNGYVFVAGGGANGIIVLNAGGLDAAHTRAVIPSDGGVQIVSTSQPTCNAAHRGTVFYQAGAPGVADVRSMCMKDSSDVYSWVSF